MKHDFFELYDRILEGIDAEEPVLTAKMGTCWTSVGTRSRYGIAMTTDVTGRPQMLEKIEGQPLRQAAQTCKGWNLREAGYGMAAVNAFYNTTENLARLHSAEPFENYCTAGLDLRDRKIGVVGHLKMPDFVARQAREVLILERSPRPGDYPDSACDAILPGCDIVLITGATLVNKTLPHLLELSRNAVTILAGPTVPMCPALLECGIDRLAGLVIENRAGMERHIAGEGFCSPYGMGTPFLLKREDLR